MRRDEHALVPLDTAGGDELERIKSEFVFPCRRIVPLMLRDGHVGVTGRDGDLYISKTVIQKQRRELT